MVARVKENRDHFDKTFCLTIAWMEAAYHGLYGAENVFIWEADEDTGRLVLMGSPELCQQFQHEAGLIIQALPDPEDEWRKL